MIGAKQPVQNKYRNEEQYEDHDSIIGTTKLSTKPEIKKPTQATPVQVIEYGICVLIWIRMTDICRGGQKDSDLYLRVVERKPDGIVENGCKAHQIGIVNSNEVLCILRLIENLTLGTGTVGYRTESMHGAGSPQAQRIMIQRLGNIEQKKTPAKNIAKIDS